MKWQLLSTLLVGALCFCSAAAEARLDPDEMGASMESGAIAADQSGRLLQLRAKPRPRRQARSVLEGYGGCKSIIAVGGWSKPPDSANAKLEGKTTLPFDRSLGTSFTVPYEGEDPQTGTDEEFVCELEDGKTLPIQGTEEQMQKLRAMLNSGELVSAQTSVEVEDVVGDEDATALLPGDGESETPEVVTLPAGAVKVVDKKEGTKTRRLASNMYEGVKKTLVVRVTDKEGLEVPEDADFISDKWFGTSGDTVTPMRGFNDCSHGKFRMTNNYEGAIDEDLLSAPGVLEVTVNIKLRESTQSQVRNKVAVAVQQKLSLTSLPGPFDHVS